MWSKNNSFTYGLISGIIIPLVSYGLFFLLFQLLEAKGYLLSGSLLRTLSIVAIGLNAIPMNVAHKRKQTDTMRGISIPTFIYVAVWLFQYGPVVLGDFTG